MPNEELQNQINPQESAGSAASKGIGAIAGTAAVFMVGQALGMAAFSKGKSQFFKLMKESSKATLRSAAEYAETAGGGSLTSFIAQTRAGGLSEAAASLYKASTNPISQQFAKKTAKQDLLSQFKSLRELPRAERGQVIQGMAGQYARETAVLAPLF